MSKEELQVNFRMPASLKWELEALAKRNRRSLTAEIVARLERSVSEPDEIGISDRDRMNPEHRFYSPDAGEQIATRIHKDRLTSGADDVPLLQDDMLVAAMVRALRIVEHEKDKAVAQPSTGPKSRKRYPKE